MEINLAKPVPLSRYHEINSFSSGQEELDQFLKTRALKNEMNYASRTFIVTEENKAIGYYSLAVGSISHGEAIRKVRHNMPNLIPVMVLGRLAVDQSRQGQGIGTALLKDALLRTLQAAEIAGIKAILVHALDQKAAQFYEIRGFKRSLLNDMTLMLTLNEIKQELESALAA